MNTERKAIVLWVTNAKAIRTQTLDMFFLKKETDDGALDCVIITITNCSSLHSHRLSPCPGSPSELMFLHLAPPLYRG